MTIAPTVSVSDHALLRYLERVKGIDIEAARKEIVEIAGVAAALGASCKAHDGHVFVIDDYTVKTVLPRGGKPSRRSRPTGRYQFPAKGAAR